MVLQLLSLPPSKIEAAFEASGKDRFNQIKRSYDKNWGTAAKEISGVVRKVLEVSDANLEAKSLWNLEHNYLKGIIETQVKDAIDNALLEEEAISRASVHNFFKGMGIELDVIRNGGHRSHGSIYRLPKSKLKRGRYSRS